MYLKQFGGKITADLLKQYQQSPNWQDGSFKNLEETVLDTSLFKIPSILYKQVSNRKAKEPKHAIPIKAFDKKHFLSPSLDSKFIWYGHSAIMMRMAEKTILIDPMFGDNVTPIAPFPTRRFSENTLSFIGYFPNIDLVLLTHDHYDHLDYASIQKLKPMTKEYYVALGLKRHLISWGVEPQLITEFDWWDEQGFGDLNISFTPTRHFSGRRIRDRQKSLWGGWSICSENERIWFSGDGGYGSHFKEIGKRLGPFDFAFMECGQYNEEWRPVHLFPDESVQAALDAGVKKAMPVHWGGFYLSYFHSWAEPADEFIQSAEAKEINHLVPEMGEIFEIGSTTTNRWWKSE